MYEPVFASSLLGVEIATANQKRGADAQLKNDRGDDEQKNDLRRNFLRKNAYLHGLLGFDDLRE
jgi:hypothetical protein